MGTRRVLALLTSAMLAVMLVPAAAQPAAAEPASARVDLTSQSASAPVMQVSESPDGLQLHASFVSSVGWVKPGDEFPFRVFVTNPTATEFTAVEVTITAPPSATFLSATPVGGAGTATVGNPSFTWEVGNVAAGTEEAPTLATLVVVARAATLAEDAEVVWKDLSSTASMTYTALVGDPVVSVTHGPKVIPPSGGFETARYGDKPFPIVPVEYDGPGQQLHHQPESELDGPGGLNEVVNSPDVPGSTFNLYQEMSYGQLYPQGVIPSVGVETADFTVDDPDFTGWDFMERDNTQGTCLGQTYGENDPLLIPNPLYQERIVDGWYQLPGDTNFYGQDWPVFTRTTTSIDDACGPLGKAVYDAAHIADPDIDYNQFDSDKDGVVDFFMMLFVGCGGNGPSQQQTNCPYLGSSPPYDNIWPHSSSLEMQFTDADTGLRGYISDDQLKSLEEVPQCWLDENFIAYDDCAASGGPGVDELPVFVRVGPYNVNPETAIQSASVISHEYGHHLGLPDFYRSGSQYYADTNLMAADFGQHMTIFAKQDMGWVVPNYVQPGTTVPVSDWGEIKTDIGQIHWQTPDGTPYTLSEANGDQNIHNGQAYGLKLPGRQLIDPEIIPSGTRIWWSGRGNDFGCPPTGGHNLDVLLPELENYPDAVITVEFMSSWDIEWDWDYGFVMTTTDGLEYTSQPSEEGYTTENTYNPNDIQCQEEFNHGITGTSGAYEAGEPEVTLARNPAANDYGHGAPFLLDRYDISELAGATNPVLRFSYNTDAAFDRPGWFIDDIVVKADDEIIYQSDFETDSESERLFPGGCSEDGVVAATCTAGWLHARTDVNAPFDQAYYLELRDQTGFDFNGWGQSNRGDTSWDPGVFLEYTDEWHGYGNNGVEPPPAQHYIDSVPNPGSDCVVVTGSSNAGTPLETPGNCMDLAFLGANIDEERSHFDDFVDEDQPGGYVNSFSDPGSEYTTDDVIYCAEHDTTAPCNDLFWHFDYGCLDLDVTSMSGNEIGPEPSESDRLPQDLEAAAVISGGDGCAEFTFGGPLVNEEPTAIAQARPLSAPVGEPITFDGSASFDDLSAPSELTYAWDFGDNSGADQQTQAHSYREAGEYTATLTVTDEGGLTGTAEVVVTVTEDAAPVEPTPTPAPSAGGAASPTPRIRFIPNTAGEPEGAIGASLPLVLLLAASLAVFAASRRRGPGRRPR